MLRLSRFKITSLKKKKQLLKRVQDVNSNIINLSNRRALNIKYDNYLLL
jgi:hypothetical protein